MVLLTVRGDESDESERKPFVGSNVRLLRRRAGEAHECFVFSKKHKVATHWWLSYVDSWTRESIGRKRKECIRTASEIEQCALCVGMREYENIHRLKMNYLVWTISLHGYHCRWLVLRHHRSARWEAVVVDISWSTCTIGRLLSETVVEVGSLLTLVRTRLLMQRCKEKLTEESRIYDAEYDGAIFAHASSFYFSCRTR